jgi:hypothetical protein|nr:MAG TPA: Transcriptional regulator LsrR transcriptional regulator, Phospho-AI-2 binding [Caudoviricetes sp.]
MKLTKDEVALLDKDPKGLLVRAYRLYYPEMSTREVAKRVGLSHTKVHQIFTAEFTAGFTAKSAPPKGKQGIPFTPEFTPEFTAGDTKVAKKEPTLTALLKPIFESFFKSRTNMDFVWSAKDMKSLKDFGEKLRASIKAKDNPHDDEHIASALPIFLSKIDDPWVLSHLSPSILNSKYNELISHISRQRTLTRAEERQQADNALEVLRAGAMSVRQR